MLDKDQFTRRCFLLITRANGLEFYIEYELSIWK